MIEAVVVGAGGFGREAAAWFEDANPDGTVLGFLDQDPSRHGKAVGGYRVLGDLDWLEEREDSIQVVLGVGSPAARRDLTELLREKDLTPLTVVHPTATIGARVSIGDGSIVCPGVVLTVDVEVGRCALLNLNVTVGHDVIVGDFAVLAPGADVAGSVIIGSGADIGIGASVLQGLEVGEGAIVGGGACVTRPVPTRHVAVGVPASPIKEHDRW